MTALRAGMILDETDRVEINEAFACRSGGGKELGLDQKSQRQWRRIALGDPLG